jgi:hypothetical protein
MCHFMERPLQVYLEPARAARQEISPADFAEKMLKMLRKYSTRFSPSPEPAEC